MPEYPNPKLRQPPSPGNKSVAPSPYAYAELDVKTNFSFLRGASHADELVYRAAELGYRAIGVTDVNSLAGVVRAHEAAREVGLKLLIGARLTFADAPDLLVWATDRAAYGRLCRLLTLGKRRAEKGKCDLKLGDFLNDNQGLLAAMEQRSSEPQPGANPDSDPKTALHLLHDSLGDRLSLVASCAYGPDDASQLEQLAELSKQTGVPLLATNGVHYHDPARRQLQDVLTCVRHGCTIGEAGYRLFPNGERYLKPTRQMHRLFADHPQAIRRGVQIAEQCHFRLDSLRYEYPNELTPPGQSPIQYLSELAWAGAAGKYPGGIPHKVRDLLNHELRLIEQLQFEAYFLTVHDLVRFARSRGILCQGRGSAANSAVCYCIGVTSVDPAAIDLLFERFISAARNEPPDIDIDFEHERREEVIQYIYQKYGRERAGMTAEVITYRGRSAVRDVGKAMGLSLDMIDTMASKLDWWHRGVLNEQQLRECGLDPDDANVRRVISIATELLGFPRHLSQHVGGMVMTRGPLCEMVPIENASMPDRTVIEWDKDDIDSVGILKVDALALGMLTCISKAFKLIEGMGEEGTEARSGEGRRFPCFSPSSPSRLRASAPPSSPPCLRAFVPSCLPTPSPLELHTIPPDDPAVYDMISNADTVGVFQVESRAQMSMLPRLRPRTFYDLVIEVAIVRPGPIQGNMVHPYLRRRSGEEEITFPSEALREVLKKTLGVPLFQEQAMRIAMVAAGFTAEEADKLRRVMAAWRRSGAIETFHQKIVQGMIGNGYTPEFAEQCFNQIKGFGEYGFPESHAASFALLVYVSAWLKRHHPAAFAAGLLNSQPMGFYMPAQIVRDAQEHGVEVRPAGINESAWDCTLEVGLGRHGGEGVGRHEGTEARRHEGEDGEKHGNRLPPPLRAFVPSCLRASPQTTNGPILRLGFREIKGFREAHARKIVAARNRCGRFSSIEQFHQSTQLPFAALRMLAEADAFGSLGLSRRQALWEVLPFRNADPLRSKDFKRLKPMLGGRDQQTNLDGENLFNSSPGSHGLEARVTIDAEVTQDVILPAMPLGQEVMTDYSTVGLSLKKHPVALIREELKRRNILSAAELENVTHGTWVKVAGLVLIRQRPGTASGIVFETLEDETGIVNLIVKPNIYDRYRPAARHAGLLQADGYLQRQGNIVHVLPKRLFDLSDLIRGYQLQSRDFH